MQRRDTFRLPIPHAFASDCFIDTPRGIEAIIALADVSLGGVGLIGFSADIELQTGMTLKGCRIELRHVGAIHCTLNIGQQTEIILPNGIRTIRTGCQFSQLSVHSEQLLQRFIFMLEHASLTQSAYGNSTSPSTKQRV
ncbi:PilZ domain-containing protein [Chitinibacter sp. S2-10]|uniref:PilZ domain-containing protein n=1 Tax=Chitinibacter sp. S2-10 TaxID=3373597 RepID=UPI003977B264